MPKAAATVELTQEQVDAVQAWTIAKSALDLHKDAEMELRLEATKLLPFKADKEEGGQTLTLSAGWKLQLTRTMLYQIETKNSQAVLDALGKLHAHSPESQAKAAHLVTRWEPVMSVEVYKSLTEEEKKIVAEVVTIKPGTPQLSLKPPAEPKA